MLKTFSSYILVLVLLLSCTPNDTATYAEDEFIESKGDEVESIVDTLGTTPKDDKESLTASSTIDYSSILHEPIVKPVEMFGSMKYNADYQSTYHYTITNNTDKAIIAYEIGFVSNYDEIIDIIKKGEAINYTYLPIPEPETSPIVKVKERINPKSNISSSIEVNGENVNHIMLLSYITEDGVKSIMEADLSFLRFIHRKRDKELF